MKINERALQLQMLERLSKNLLFSLSEQRPVDSLPWLPIT